MSFVRPEVAALLQRWGEALGGAAALGLGLWLVTGSGGLAFLFGLALSALGAALVFTGTRRARRPQDGGGVGIVEVDERRISYFTGTGGGSISVDQLVSVRVEPGGRGPFLWHFIDDTGALLTVPSDAENAGTLFDVLYALPGFDASDVFDVGALVRKGPFVAWEKPRARLH